MSESKRENSIVVLHFGKNQPPKCIGIAPNAFGMAAVLAISRRLKTEGYEYGMSVKPEDVGEAIFGLGFDEVKDWKNFVYIVNHQDKLFDEYLEKIKEKEDGTEAGKLD